MLMKHNSALRNVLMSYEAISREMSFLAEQAQGYFVRTK